MLTIRISPIDYRSGGPSIHDVYSFRFEYCLGDREFKIERIFSTGEPDGAFDAMFEIARREIRAALPALRLGNPTLFATALREAARMIENALHKPPLSQVVEKP